MEILSKFTVGSDKSVDELFDLKKKITRSKYKENVSEENIENYLQNLDHRKMINTLNDFSNQLITIFVDDEPVGYCFSTTGESYLEAPENKKMTVIKDFAILPEHRSSDVKLSLWNKVRASIKFAESIWINIEDFDEEKEFFKENQFVFVKNTFSEIFSLPSSIYKLDLNV